MTIQPLTTEEPPYKVGDVVRLKSGGPAMAVSGTSTSQPNSVHCIWITAVGQVNTAKFPALSLAESKPDAWPLS